MRQTWSNGNHIKVKAEIFLTYPGQRYSPLCAGEKFEIPNEIMMLWFGDVGETGRNAIKWNRKKAKLEELGFAVFHHVNDGPEHKEWLDDVTFLQHVADKSKNRQLQGLYVVGHGRIGGFGVKAQPNPRGANPALRKALGYQGKGEFWVKYADIDNRLKYNLGVGILAVCWGGHSGAAATPPLVSGRDLFVDESDSPGVVFHGEDRIYVPIIKDNVNLDELFEGGKQGTKK